MLYAKVKDMEEETMVEINSDTALAIGYILKQHQNSKNKEVLRRLLHWENSGEIKMDLKKKKRQKRLIE